MGPERLRPHPRGVIRHPIGESAPPSPSRACGRC
jgi:hypothetical protein